MNANGVAPFAIFVQCNRIVPFDTADNRIFFRAVGSVGAERGATSVAVRTR